MVMMKTVAKHAFVLKTSPIRKDRDVLKLTVVWNLGNKKVKT